jgi:hypothetical protein
MQPVHGQAECQVNWAAAASWHGCKGAQRGGWRLVLVGEGHTLKLHARRCLQALVPMDQLQVSLDIIGATMDSVLDVIEVRCPRQEPGTAPAAACSDPSGQALPAPEVRPTRTMPMPAHGAGAPPEALPLRPLGTTAGQHGGRDRQ